MSVVNDAQRRGMSRLPTAATAAPALATERRAPTPPVSVRTPPTRRYAAEGLLRGTTKPTPVGVGGCLDRRRADRRAVDWVRFGWIIGGIVSRACPVVGRSASAAVHHWGAAGS